jgi:hypothetical protein
MDALPAELIVAIAAHLGEPDRAALRAAAPWLAACLPAAWCFDLERHALRQMYRRVDPDMLRAIDLARVRNPLELVAPLAWLGDTTLLRELTAHHPVVADALCSCHHCAWLAFAVQGGHLDMVRHLTDASLSFRYNVRYAVQCAVRDAAMWGRLPVVEYLTERFGLTAKDVRAEYLGALQFSAANGHLPVVRYLVETFGLTSEDARGHHNWALRESASHGHLEVLRYLVETFRVNIR